MASQKLIIVFFLVLVYWGYDTVANADRKYSSESYWDEATLLDVANVPDTALLSGNEYGSVLMFATSVNTNPSVISELLKRGSDVNEVEPMFSGTPLSAAAAKNPNPEIINLLIKHGAKVNVTLSQGRTPLINAVINNNNKGIITALIQGGAEMDTKDELGLTAMDYAKKLNKPLFEQELLKFSTNNSVTNL